MELAILIPTLRSRNDLFLRATGALQSQIALLGLSDKVVMICSVDDGEKSTGQKRNELVETAIAHGAKYIASLDDDDVPGETYVKNQYDVVKSGKDCGSLWGQIYWNGKEGKPFHHSIKYKEAWEDDKFYYRAPNHLNCIKLDLVKDIKFQPKNFGEDGCWMEDIHNAGVLKTEHEIKDIIYHYFCGNPKYKVI